MTNPVIPVAAFISIGVLVGCYFIVQSVAEDTAREKTCLQKGGVYYQFRGGSLCLKPEAVVR